MALDPLIETLLVLQERDVRRDELQKRLDEIPSGVAGYESKIAAAKAVLQKTLDEEKAIELARRDLEKQMTQAENDRAKFRTQQMAVKKNDEYAALEKQIDGAGVLIDGLETKTMEAMLKIDEFAPVVKKQRETTAAEIAKHQAGIESLLRVKAELEKDLAASSAETDAARAKVPAEALATYLYVKTRVKRPPYVVPAEDGRCLGCHLKISSDITSQMRVRGVLTRCGSCGRIVYMEH